MELVKIGLALTGVALAVVALADCVKTKGIFGKLMMAHGQILALIGFALMIVGTISIFIN